MATSKVRIIEMSACVAPGYPPCTEFYVYVGEKLVQVCPSRGMAEEAVGRWL